jgi:hypothetical protein
MKRNALAALLACALGVTSCARTGLELSVGISGAEGAPDAQIADAGDDARGAEAAAGAPCQWTFAPQVKYVSDGSAAGIAIGDFNGDHVSDILTLNSPAYGGGNDVSLFVNHGDGTFEPQRTFATGSMPFALAVADFSGDGSLDLAVIYEYQAPGVSNELSVFLNRGNGTFAPAVQYAINGGGFVLTTGDFNRDGAADLALVDAKATVTVLTNRGDGTFGPPASYNAGPAADFLAAADFDRDGAVDLVVGGTFSENVLSNQGDGTFALPVTYPNSTACDDVGPIIASDVSGDGYPDLIRSCYQGTDAVAVRTNNGNGTFGQEVNYTTGEWPTQLTVGDFFGTGRNDLAVANSWAYANSVSVLPNAGNGTFASQLTYAVSAPYVVAAGDLNHDGHADIATAGGAVSVLLSVCK